MSKKDPTNQRRTRSKATKEFNRRAKVIQRRVIELFDTIPRSVKASNAAADVFWLYTYDVQQLQTEILTIVNQEVGTIGETMPPDWWFIEYDTVAHNSGARQENANIAVIAAVATGLFLLADEQLLLNPALTINLANELAFSYTSAAGLSDRTSRDLAIDIIKAMMAANPPNEIKRIIRSRIGVLESSIRRWVDSEINRVYNDARLATVNLYNDVYDAGLKVEHISALLPTTRETHARRHRKTYTVEEQTRWWDSGANRINCHCSVRATVDRE